jgi:putative oxidoreductase
MAQRTAKRVKANVAATKKRRQRADPMFAQLLAPLNNLIAYGNRTGYWVSAFVLRLLLAVEFYASGIEKLRGENWFGEIQSQFPFPFNVIPPDISWSLATMFEIGGAVALLLGIGTRFFALSLMVLTVVATAAVHWPESWSTLGELAQGYVITDHGHGNFKLPLIYLVMFVPLLLNGPGRASVDYWVMRRFAPMHY